MKQRDTHAHGAEDELSEHRLYEAITAIRTVEEAKQFFEDLCTPTERQALYDRWRVVEPIKQGVPYRTIHDQTGVSVTTIGRVARCIHMGTGGYNLIFERIKRKTHAQSKINPSTPEKGATD